MGKVIGNSGQFELWLRDFLPSLFNEDFELEPGEVIDRYVFTVHQNGFDKKVITLAEDYQNLHSHDMQR